MTLSANASAVVEQTTYKSTVDWASEIATTAGSTTLLDLKYSYDSNGNPTKETPTIGSTTQTVENFALDQADRVDNFWTGTGSAPNPNNINYGNDGEITQNGTVSAAQGMGYDQAGELCWASPSTSSNACSSPPTGSTAYAFNADGERTTVTQSSGNTQAYAWNAHGDLVCANTNGSSCSLSNPTSSTTLYGYDGNGLRTSSTINSTTTSYTWDTSQSIARLLVSGSTDYVYGFGAAPVEQISGSAADLLLADPIGSAHGLVQLTGGSLQNTLVNYTDYDAYGNPSNAGGLTQSHASINANWTATSSFGFMAAYTDGSGLLYLGPMYYDPTTGQGILRTQSRVTVPTAISGPSSLATASFPTLITTSTGSFTCNYAGLLSLATETIDAVSFNIATIVAQAFCSKYAGKVDYFLHIGLEFSASPTGSNPSSVGPNPSVKCLDKQSPFTCWNGPWGPIPIRLFSMNWGTRLAG